MSMKYDLNKIWYSDLSFWSLLIANLVSIVLAVFEQWNLIIILWIYWGQNIVIGIFNFKKMRLLENKQNKNPESIGNRLNMIKGPSLFGHMSHFMSSFFLVHYGFFHFVYFIFLSVFSAFGDEIGFGNIGAQTNAFGLSFLFVVIGIGAFLFHHWFSYNSNKKNGTLFGSREPSLNGLMGRPYLRIVPMHILIVLGVWFSGEWQLIIFLVLKTIVDLLMHISEHR